MRYPRVKIEGATYFFTVVTHKRQQLLSDAQSVQLLTDAITKVQNRHPFEIEAQVILPDHLHAVWTLPDGDANYATRWRLIKEAFTRGYCGVHGAPSRTMKAHARGEQPIWQRRFWEHTLLDERDFAAHVDYIHHNPVRHGLVAAPRDWPHSTFTQWVERGVYESTWCSEAMPELPEWAKRCE